MIDRQKVNNAEDMAGNMLKRAKIPLFVLNSEPRNRHPVDFISY